MQRGHFIPALLFLFSCTSLRAQDDSPLPTPAEIQVTLHSPDGLTGLVHGSVPGVREWVLSYRPRGIFREMQLSLIPGSAAIAEQLKNAHRHDRIQVWGDLLDNPSPQLHLKVSRLNVLAPYTFPGPPNAPIDAAALERDLSAHTQMDATVHAVSEGGKILVVEYHGAVLPIFNPDHADLAQNLNRQDYVRLRYTIQTYPGRPFHLQLQNGAAGEPALELVNSVHAQNGQDATLEGTLVLFPQSPDIRFNVFAILLPETASGRERTYTIVNFTDMDRFTEIRNFLQAAWDHADPHAIENHRNKLINPTVRVRAHGVLNHSTPGQANPQIVVDGVGALTIVAPSR